MMHRIEFPVELTNKAMLEQRIVYIKRLLDSQDLTETITILIELRKLADNTVMDSGTDF